jgi:radical SAM superfamily enzyme YgiQ (UPF0313 family)
MKALLVYPPIPPGTFWGFKHVLNFIRKKAAHPPVGVATVAAMLPREWDLRPIDMNTDSLTDEDLDWAEIVFISAMVVQRDSAHQVINRAKRKGKIIVAGGPLFTVEYEDFDKVDHFVLNEAELTLPPFLNDYSEGRAKRVYSSAEFADLKETPVPRWDLFDLKKYASMSIQFSRGCPFNCDFCNVTALLGRRVRIKTAAQIITELDKLYELGWRGSVFFVDDNFIGNRKFLMDELLSALIEWRQGKKRLRFNTEASIDLVDNPDLMNMMVKAGFESVFIGIETPDEEGLAECNKKQNKGRNLVECVKTIQRFGLQVQGGFIVGFDSDSPSIFQRQIDFIQKSGIVTAMVGLLQAPVGTPLYARMKKEKRILKLVTGDNMVSTNIDPKMGLEALTDGFREILKIYQPGLFYKRIRTFLREYKAPRISFPADRQHFLAFPRSMIRLGIFGKERWQYWGLLFWTLFRRPKQISLAVTLAIYGFHFRKICDLLIVK